MQRPDAARTAAATAASDSGGAADGAKLARRRLQYKMHQRRHRAKQKQRIETLEREVHELLAEIASAELHSRRLRSVFASRGTRAGAPARVALEYFSVYEHGFSARRWADQERFLQGVMSSAVEGPDYVGVEFIKHQWRLYGRFFASTRYDIQGYDVETVGDMTVVVVDAVVSIRPRRDGVTTLCPSLAGHEELIQAVIGSPIVVPGKYRFIFDAAGAGSWLGADLDFVSALQQTFRSLENVALVMRGANLSFSTGQVRCEAATSSSSGGGGGASPPPAGRRSHTVDHRHHLDFLLAE
ncbi:hypothetical protein PybrP1_005995 [[Pythium] brassicae (nom. inval.)]|nr:hypothetical protein PybrP1_005995 [[Pythium] brassicae (nom. inval.)]